MHLLPNKHYISVGARSSQLSQTQLQEVLAELQRHHPSIDFHPYLLETTGDLDQTTSLRNLGKTDFFTREIDIAQAHGEFRISVHSAKDLADLIHPNLEIISLTKGQDPSDSLVLPEGETLESLPSQALIATSSERRQQAVNALRADLTFADIRGSIPKRLEQLDMGRVDGIVIAEAALIRLNLLHLNRVTLPGETVKFQGQLAIVAKKGDNEMKQLFSPLDSR
jgi:hydroxymethylbilane synthase